MLKSGRSTISEKVLAERTECLVEDEMREIAHQLRCTVAEVGAPTMDGNWHYWIEKRYIAPDSAVLQRYMLHPFLMVRNEELKTI